MKLHLGVIDVPYRRAPQPPPKVPKAKKGKKNKPIKPPKVEAGAQTTGDVAGWLEDKYDVMGDFVTLHETEMATLLGESLAGAIETMAMGGPVQAHPFGTALGQIESQFRNYLDHEDITQTGQMGVPTQAAQDGVNHRLKSKKGVRRPSFIDSGLYESSFRAWID